MKLSYYVVRRVLLMIPILIGATLIVFLLTRAGGTQMIIGAYLNPHLPPGPQKAALIKQFHLDSPLYVQYLYFIEGLLHGNWGYTHTPIYSGPVTTAIMIFFPNTLQLAVVAFIIALAIGIPLGTLAAVRKDSWVDQITRLLAFIGISLPIFWLAELMQTYLATNEGIKILPIGGTVTGTTIGSVSWISGMGISSPTHVMIIDALIHGNLTVFFNALGHVILPAITLAFASIAGVMRYMRNSAVETMNLDYVRFARAKGLHESVVIRRYARKNALIPVITVSGLLFAGLLAGVVVIETIFNYPGIGYWTVQAMRSFDPGGIMGATLLFTLTIVTANLVVDIIYAYIDPRIRLGG